MTLDPTPDIATLLRMKAEREARPRESRSVVKAKEDPAARFTPVWTPERDALLGELYKTTPYAEIATRLGSTLNAVRSRCSVLGLKKNRSWTDAERNAIAIWYTTHPVGTALDLDELGRQLGRTRFEVCRQAKDLGLTSYRRPKPDGYGVGAAERSTALWQRKPHPRGMAGKKHSPEGREHISAGLRANPRTFTEADRQRKSDQMLARHASGELGGASNSYSRCRQGRRTDLGGQYFRSAWEANYARYLNWLISQGVIKSWEYEPDTFWFEKIRRGVRSYTPDFKVVERGLVHYDEVKGWLDAKSKTKLARMKKYHPAVDLRLIDTAAYREIARKIGVSLPGWES